MDLELEADEYDAAFKADREDFFSACLHLGRAVGEFDIESDSMVERFRRDEADGVGADGKRNWERSLTTIRKLLKKYHSHEDLPMRRFLAKLHVLRHKLLPMISLFHHET
jgi:hypothetical protein